MAGLELKSQLIHLVLSFLIDEFTFFSAFPRYTGLPNTKLGIYLENRVNNFLKNKDAGAGEVTIRVLSSSDKSVEVKQGMKSRYVSYFIDSH